MPDKSNGYEEIAEHFIAARNSRIGPVTVREWSQVLPRGIPILDLGCGHGVISQVLMEEGFTVYGVDASAKLISAFRQRFPGVYAECAGVEDSEFFGRTFDAIVAWGLIFILPAELQPLLIRKVAKALNPGGKFLFTFNKDAITWNDSLTGRESRSLGAEQYKQILHTEGLVVDGTQVDEGENYYYFASKP